MTSLLDIGPLTEEISVGGKSVTVWGVTPEGFFYLLEKFPLLRQIFGGGIQDINMDTLREVAPDSIAFVLAVATTDRNEFKSAKEWIIAIEASAKVAVNLSAHFQMALFQATLDLTFPDGVGPFMEAVNRLGNSINRVSGKTAPVITSSKQSRSGFAMDSHSMRLGRAAHRANSRH